MVNTRKDILLNPYYLFSDTVMTIVKKKMKSKSLIISDLISY
jgi:hypothetical protein